MVGARLIGVWAAVALALLAFASAAAGATTLPFPQVWSFKVQGTHGYLLRVLAEERSKSSPGEVQILVGNRHSRVFYDAPASVSETALEADLGSLGRIALQVQPSGFEKTVRSSCSKIPYRYEAVRFVGEFEFKGEEGYTEASATSLPMLVEPLVEAPCVFYGELKLGGGGLLGAGIHIGSHGLAPHVRMSARTNGPGKAVEVSASIDEKREEIEIDRAVGGSFPPSAFGYDAHLRRAALAPPTPFSGRGLFRRRAAPANRWTGSLRVDFPGRSGVALTGDRFRPVLRHGEWRTDVSHVHARLAGPTLPVWPSTKPWPTASVRSSPLGPS